MEGRLKSIIENRKLMNSLEHIGDIKWSFQHWTKIESNGFNMVLMNQEDKYISQPNSHGDEVEECNVQEWLTVINR